MTPIAPHITAFLRERLPLQRGASPNTCESYAYTFQLLFEFASARFKVTPSKLCIEQIDSILIMDFLAHIESERGNSPRTRNARLAAIKSFMRFVEHRIVSFSLPADQRAFFVVTFNSRTCLSASRRPRSLSYGTFCTSTLPSMARQAAVAADCPRTMNTGSMRTDP